MSRARDLITRLRSATRPLAVPSAFGSKEGGQSASLWPGCPYRPSTAVDGNLVADEEVSLVELKVIGVLVVGLVAVVGCGGSATESSAGDESSDGATATVPASIVPVVSTGVVGPADVDWNWQLTGELDRSVGAEVWDVDLFDTGVDKIASLQSDGRYVICYFSAGSIEDWRPDVGGIEESAIGLQLDDWPGEKWLDVRADSVLALVESRMAVAEQAGCDAVEPDNVDGFSNETGFSLSESDQIIFNSSIANMAHARGLAVGLKNSFDIAESLVQHFDFAVTEQCHEYDECELLELFVEVGKPVFNAEYPGDEGAAGELAGEQCAESNALGIHTLFLPIDLDGSWRVSCEGR